VLAAFGGAVDVPAQGAGTMSNTTFGTETWTYYETLGGGQGAGPRADGPSAVHVAMSNALNTPVEALELAYPLRVERYALRRGSGGDGRHRGGDGVVREIRVLAPCRLSVLGDRRRHAPRGAHGGDDGARGRTLVDGEEIPGKDTRSLVAGDVVRTETPGGGGWGALGH
jgi:N-methylhydantoinase B